VESLTWHRLLNHADLRETVENDQDRIQVKGGEGLGRPESYAIHKLSLLIG
jgi:hypothetical protein